MNKTDWEELLPDDRAMLAKAKDSLGLEVKPEVSVPTGYVLDTQKDTIYKLETFLRMVEQGLAEDSERYKRR